MMPPRSRSVVETGLGRLLLPRREVAIRAGEHEAAEGADRGGLGRRRQAEDDRAEDGEDHHRQREERRQQHLEDLEALPVHQPGDQHQAGQADHEDDPEPRRRRHALGGGSGACDGRLRRGARGAAMRRSAGAAGGPRIRRRWRPAPRAAPAARRPPTGGSCRPDGGSGRLLAEAAARLDEPGGVHRRDRRSSPRRTSRPAAAAIEIAGSSETNNCPSTDRLEQRRLAPRPPNSPASALRLRRAERLGERRQRDAPLAFAQRRREMRLQLGDDDDVERRTARPA